VVLNEGRIAEVGGYEELMARRGLFYTLVQLQQHTPSTTVPTPI
jgi:ABC-type multidrug transport system fused ATPase/permease subunit